MSSSSNEEQEPNQELDQMRERIRQYQEQVSQTAQFNRELQQKVDGLELELQVRALFAPKSAFTTSSPQSPTRNVVSCYIG